MMEFCRATTLYSALKIKVSQFSCTYNHTTDPLISGPQASAFYIHPAKSLTLDSSIDVSEIITLGN